MSESTTNTWHLRLGLDFRGIVRAGHLTIFSGPPRHGLVSGFSTQAEIEDERAWGWCLVTKNGNKLYLCGAEMMVPGKAQLTEEAWRLMRTKEVRDPKVRELFDEALKTYFIFAKN